MTIHKRTHAIPSISELRDLFHDRMIAPGGPEYNNARTGFYGGIDRRPAAIIRVADADDVSRVVSFARESGLELAVRSGGHSLAGHSTTEGGLVLDLSRMKDLQIDARERTAWAETGLTAGEYTVAAGAYGLATGFGDTRSVGIGGITLGGGIGYFVRKYGLTIDDLLAAEIVTADGQLLRVDHETHADLFWAIRGGGGNFGVVTRFQFRLHEVDKILGGALVLPATPEVIASFIAEADAAPDELSAIVNIMPAPPVPFIPAEYHGKLVVMATFVYLGEIESAERVFAPFRGLAVPIADMVRPMKYPEIYPPEQDGYHPIAATRTLFLDTLDRSAAATIIEKLHASTGLMAIAQLRVLGGAMARVPADATAFAHRKSRILINLIGLYGKLDEKPVHKAWVSEFANALPQSDRGIFVNFLGDLGETYIHAAYPDRTWERLAAIKAQYDPANLFHLNQNIPPTVRQPATTLQK